MSSSREELEAYVRAVRDSQRMGCTSSREIEPSIASRSFNGQLLLEEKGFDLVIRVFYRPFSRDNVKVGVRNHGSIVSVSESLDKEKPPYVTTDVLGLNLSDEKFDAHHVRWDWKTNDIIELTFPGKLDNTLDMGRSVAYIP